MNYVKSKIILLPTGDKTAPIGMDANGKLYLSTLNLYPQHLYFTTGERPVIGNYYIVELFKITGESDGFHVEKCETINDNWVNNKYIISTRHIDNCKKIIASTDPSLNLPRPSSTFLRKYCENNGINEVLIEMKMVPVPSHPYQIKVSSDNTITIRQIKTSYTQDEVDELLDKQVCETTAQILERYKSEKGLFQELKELRNDSAELRSLKQSIIESGLFNYAPKREDISFHDKVVFSIFNLIEFVKKIDRILTNFTS